MPTETEGAVASLGDCRPALHHVKGRAPASGMIPGGAAHGIPKPRPGGGGRGRPGFPPTPRTGSPVATDAAALDHPSALQTGHSLMGGVAHRYALALLELAKDSRTVDAVAAEVEGLAGLIRDDVGFRAFLADPRLDAVAQTKGAFAVLDRAGIAGDLKKMVGVLIANRRLAILSAVLADFGKLLAEQRGQQTADVTTAHPLSAVQRTQIAARLTEAGYSNVRLAETVDPSILGGLIVRIGSRLYDTSIKSRLQRLSYAMKGAA